MAVRSANEIYRSPESIRDSVLRYALLAAVAIGFPLVLFAVIRNISEGKWALVALDVFLYGGLVAAALSRNRTLQTSVVVGILWIMGTALMVYYGSRSDALVAYLALIVFVALLYDTRVTAAVLGGCLLSTFTVAGLSLSGGLDLSALAHDPQESALHWANVVFQMLFFGGGLALFIRRLQSEVGRADTIRTTLLENAEEYVMLIDPQRHFMYINRTVAGLTVEGVIGTPLFDYIPEQHREAVAECLDTVEATREPGRYFTEFADPDGSMRQFEARVTPVIDGVSFIGFAISSFDVTDLHARERDRIQFERRIQDAHRLESVGLLAGGVAHDFNNLLVGIMGNADLGRQRADDNAEVRDRFERILDSSEKAAELCRQLLVYAGKGQSSVRAVHLSEIVRDMESLFHTMASAGLEIRYELADRLPAIEADLTHIHQLLLNLVQNSVEACAPEYVSVTIATGLAGTENETRLAAYEFGEFGAEGYPYVEVSDTGPGIDREIVGKIFDPFFSSKESGHGLGLATVIGIVKSHGGVLKVYSEPKKGTTFRVYFPPTDTAAEPVSKGESGLEPPSPNGSATVLVVDDDTDVLTVAAAMLESAGYRPLMADSCEAACRQLRETDGDVSVVVLDMVMPVTGGVGAFHEIRAIAPDVRVVVSSGQSESEEIEAIAALGVTHFVPKPYTRAQLLHEVGAAHAEHAQR